MRGTTERQRFLRKLLALMIVCSMVVGAVSHPVPTSQASSDTSVETSSSATATDTASILIPQKLTATVYADESLQTTMTGATLEIQGNLPMGARAVAYPIDVPSSVGEVLVAYDISVYQADGVKFEPTVGDPLNVSISVPDMPDDLNYKELALVYLPETGAPQVQDTPVSQTEDGVTFQVEHLSAYVVTISAVRTFTTVIDGVAQPAVTFTANYDERTYNVTSTAPNQVHTITISSGPTPNGNLTINHIIQDNVDMLSAPAAFNTGPFSLTLTFTDTTKVVVMLDNKNSGAANWVATTMTFNIVVNDNFTADVTITDSVTTNGLLTANLSPALASAEAAGATVTYTWVKSATPEGPYNLTIDPQALSPDGKNINVATDFGGMMYYEVVANVDYHNGTTASYTSANYYVPYAMSIQNGSFEVPTGYMGGGGPVGPNNNYSNYINGTAGLVWKTTAQDKKVEICFSPGIYNLNPAKAAKGLQFAELNANYVGTLYQDVLVSPGEILYWNLAHASRSGAAETMKVVIMPTLEVPGGDNITQAQAAALTSGGNIQVETVTDTGHTWVYHNNYSTGYVVPAGVYLVRFFFVSTTGLTNAQGNLIDDVTFSAAEPYTVKYYLNGVLQTSLTTTGQQTPGSTVNAQTPAGYSGYLLQKTMLNGVDTSKPDVAPAMGFRLVVPNSILDVYYVSTGLIVYKTVTGVPPEDMPDIYTVEFDLYETDPLHPTGSLVATCAVTMIGGAISGSYQFMELNDPTTPYVLQPGTTYTYSLKEVDPAHEKIPDYTFVKSTIAPMNGVTSQSIDASSTNPTLTFTTAASGVDIYEARFTNEYIKAVAPLKFTKMTADRVTPLIGVEFKLSKIDTATGEPDPKFTPLTAVSDDHGVVLFDKLESGVYLLEETKPLPGFQAPLGNWTVTFDASKKFPIMQITANGSPPAFWIEGDVESDLLGGDASLEYFLPNYPEMTLPLTGSFGVLAFVAIGIVLMGSAVLGYRMTRKKKRGVGDESK